MQKILETARGRWHGILPQLGISPKVLRNKHGPCPICGGSDRFRFDDKEGKGTWICNRCGSGDGAELVKRVKGVPFKEAAKMVEAVVGNAAKCVSRPRPEVNKAELNSLWQESVDVTFTPFFSDPVGTHLLSRCGIGAIPSSIRSAYQDGFWIMLAKVSDAFGNPITLHRTFLKDGKVVNRKLMPGKLPDSGVAIRLAEPTPEVLGIAEGIETALSASVLFNVPVWAAISAPLLKKWRPPSEIRKVIVFGDNDESFTGQEAAYSLARALSDDVKVEVKIPSIPGWDWNDVQRNNDGNS